MTVLFLAGSFTIPQSREAASSRGSHQRATSSARSKRPSTCPASAVSPPPRISRIAQRVISAGLFALIIDHRLNLGLPPLGYVAPRLYDIATSHPGEAFEDIVGGDSSTSCDNGFPATEGWDANTGFGRPVWEGWVKYFGED